jgi:hypothetical protein
VNPRAIERLEGLSQLKNPIPPQESKPRPSGLYHSASTNYATPCPNNAILKEVLIHSHSVRKVRNNANLFLRENLSRITRGLQKRIPGIKRDDTVKNTKPRDRFRYAHFHPTLDTPFSNIYAGTHLLAPGQTHYTD